MMINRPRWTDSALSLEGEQGEGSLELRGEVHVDSRPSEFEFNTVDADSLTLNFAQMPQPDGAEPKKELVKLIARGDAKLENRTWREDDPELAPRVFFVAGQHVEYDQRTLEALVVGDGNLLIRDEWLDEGDSEETSKTGFSSKGTTLFRWSRQLHMIPQVDEVFDIVMTGDVECLHRSLDDRTATLTGQRLEATVARRTAGDDQRDALPAGALNLGGPMDLMRLYGSGGLFIRSAERDVACDEFDYNPATGLAIISAAPGRMVSVLTAGSSRPYRAQRVLWNMNLDTITITRGAASGSP